VAGGLGECRTWFANTHDSRRKITSGN
jgi:hypothetical protein